MINSIQKLKGFGGIDLFEQVDQQPKDFLEVNLFYGVNGSGKTTISNLLYLLSSNCKEKEALLKEYIEDTTEILIKTTFGNITEKNILSQNCSNYVFNSKFITDHVYNGNIAKVEKFDGNIKLTNDQIEIIDSKLTILQKRQKNAALLVEKLTKELVDIWDTYKGEFNNRISGARVTGMPDLTAIPIGKIEDERIKLDNLYLEYSKRVDVQGTIEKLNKLKILCNEILQPFTKWTDLQEVLGKKIDIDPLNYLKKKIQEISELIKQKNWQTAIGDINNWYKIGGRLLHLNNESNKQSCPLCNSDLSSHMEQTLLSFSQYFTDTANKATDVIESLLLSLDSFLNNSQLDLTTSFIDSIITQSKSLGITISELQKIDNKEFLLEVSNLKIILSQKKIRMDKEFLIDENNFKTIIKYIASIESFKKALNELVDKEIENASNRTANQIINDIKIQMRVLTTLDFNVNKSKISLLLKYQCFIKIAALKLILEEEIKSSTSLRAIEIAKLNAESKYVNLYLGYLGIDYLSINRDSTKNIDNIEITYLKSGKTKSKLNHSLSDGEKTALAFSYFISKIRVEKVEQSSELNNCVIIIDDPISSLDENRLFQTANLIENFFFYNENSQEIFPRQLFIMSHNLSFLKYLSNSLKANSSISEKVNEYFISNTNQRIINLPLGFKNFTNSYVHKVSEIYNYKIDDSNYENAKHYLPNYIRIVLETFLSFKLVLVKDGQNRLPGLSFLIQSIVKELNEAEDLVVGGLNRASVINKLNNLKKIADFESHGNILRVEEINYLSKQELQTFCKDTIQVLYYIDNLHFKKLKQAFG